MKVAPVDRYGGWRPGGAGSESRTAAANKLQSALPATASEASTATPASGRELPIVPVKQGADVAARTVLQSDRPKGLDAALNVFNEFKLTTDAATTPTTVEIFGQGQHSTDTSTAGVSGEGDAKVPRGVASPKTRGPNGDAEVNPDAAKAAKKSSDVAAQADEAKLPPKEPITKLLIDLVQNVWEASRSVVDANVPKVKAGAPLLPSVEVSVKASGGASSALASYGVAVTGR